MTKVIRYLYVEDNDDIREAFTELIEAGHRQITAVPDAETALGLMKHQVFDVLVTDVSLPVMSGVELAREWVKMNSENWVVLFSGYAFTQGLSAIGRNVRALLKSCEPEELEGLLAAIEASLNA